MLGALEKQGLDFWWIDWQQGEGTPLVPCEYPVSSTLVPFSTPQVVLPLSYPFRTPRVCV